MKFTKMHGIGNDYIYVNGFKETVMNPSEAAKRLSDRHFGVGGDGLILIQPSEKADFKMEMYNSDGSLGAMCGNGIRCVGKYVYDYGLTDQTRVSVETKSGIKFLDLTVKQGKVSQVEVDMGEPVLKPESVPVSLEGDSVIDREFTLGEKKYRITCVSMGNPHCVVPVENVQELEIEKMGPLFEHHSLFPDRVNTEFIRVLDRENVQMRVWERGSGETLACGTGACAVAVACVLNGWTQEQITVHLLGGELKIRWDREKNRVFMTGPAQTVFEGEIDLERFLD
ncbi:MAG TPA: diaminopimelate epimerase [Candidatus Choladousia intestinigallinarum]|nr:diaminopimelate epimerase [Candidatus Choladousia intestinigallinarum]